jgi:hypothetical protein
METKQVMLRQFQTWEAQDGSYYETTNYAVAESHEPGSTFSRSYGYS